MARHVLAPRPYIPSCCSSLALMLFVGSHAAALGQEKDFNTYPKHVSRYLERLYAQQGRKFEYRAGLPGGFDDWQRDARSALCLKIGLDKIVASVGDHEPIVKLNRPEDLGEYTRQRGVIETEPGIRIPFWLLKPKGKGRWPLGVFPHGHDPRGPDTTAGVSDDEAHQRKSLAEDRDVAVQAVKLGFVAVAPAVRGLAANGVPDLHGRHGKRDCRSHLMHCLLAGRTAMGERVWDMQRILDWAFTLPEVDSNHTLMMGNSGGGMVTMFTAACDERIDIAVPSCSFAPTISKAGYIFHCDCNMVPGLIDLGGLPGVCGLIAPRHLLAVNGRKDTLFSKEAVEEGAATVRMLYTAAGCPERFEHRWGAEGHRFYKDLMWPFVLETMRSDDGDGWVHLFNGRDLTGWKANVHPDSFRVVDGAIRAHCTSNQHRSHLFFVGDSDELVKFKNFELVAVFRGKPSSNSGIFFHTDMSTRDAKLHLAKGYEVNMNNSAREEQKTGSLYAVVGVNDTSIDDTKWTTVHITVRDKRIAVRLNDKQLVDYTEPEDVQRPPSRSGRRIAPDGGAIAIQAHDPASVHYFREVRIRELP